jgi:uncharacterized protein (DUF885 family)
MRILSIILISLFPFYYAHPEQGFDAFTRRFIVGYHAFPIPALEMSYVDDLRDIEPKDTVEKEIAFFKGIKDELDHYQSSTLSPNEQQDYFQIKYEVTINLERLNLEKKWLVGRHEKIPDDNIAAIPDGKAWYIYLLKRWLSNDVNPEEIFKFGMGEVDCANRHIEKLRRQTGLNRQLFYRYINSSQFLIKDPKIVQDRFEKAYNRIDSRLSFLFYPHQIPKLKIKQGPKEAIVKTPGYYRDGTFYYNLSDKPYNSRQIAWLFLHEAIPGHHFQNSIDTKEPHTKVQDMFNYIGPEEGWGAYVERYGKELGVYQTPYDELGHWEWNLVRAVRIPLDIGINYYGWTDEQALTFWKRHVRNRDDIAMREINRVRHWPAQAITYNYGAAQIAQWKVELQKRLGDKFNIKDFHEWVLAHISLPFSLAKKAVFKEAAEKRI